MSVLGFVFCAIKARKTQTMQDDTKHLVEFARFMRGISSPEFEEVDNICVPKEFFDNPFCIQHVLPLYFHVTRVSPKTSIAKLKEMFHCGSELATGPLQFRSITIPLRYNSAPYGFVTILPLLFPTLLVLRPFGGYFLPDGSITQSPRPIIATAAISHRP